MHAIPIIIGMWLIYKFPRAMVVFVSACILLLGVYGVWESKREASNLPPYPASYYKRNGIEERLDLCFWNRQESKHPDPNNPECADYFREHPEARPEITALPKKIVAPPPAQTKFYKDRVY